MNDEILSPAQVGFPLSHSGSATAPIMNVHSYVTKDGNARFTFRFAKVGNHYEADIIEVPEYGVRPSESNTTHRYVS